MKILQTVVKILVLISAAGLAVLRFVSFKYETAFSESELHMFFVISVVCAAVLILSGAVWVITVKKQEKAGKK